MFWVIMTSLNARSIVWNHLLTVKRLISLMWPE